MAAMPVFTPRRAVLAAAVFVLVFLLALGSSDATQADAVKHQVQEWTTALTGAEGAGHGGDEPGIDRSACRASVLRQKQMLYDAFAPYLQDKRHAVLLTFQDHENKGDSAIYVGQEAMLRDFNVSLDYINGNSPDWDAVGKVLRGPHKDTAVALYQGGGNFGDLYYGYTRERFECAERFPEATHVQFPVSIKFREDAKLRDTVRGFAHPKDVVFAGRDAAAWDFLRTNFYAPVPGVADGFGASGEDKQGRHDVMFTPDVATYMGWLYDEYKGRIADPVYDLVIITRKDAEIGANFNTRAQWADLKSVPRGPESPEPIEFFVEDWPSAGELDDTWMTQRAHIRTKAAIEYLTRSRLIITDRLHGHIIATMLGVPHIAFAKDETGYNKMLHYHDSWLWECEQAGISRIARTQESAIRYVREFFANGGHFSPESVSAAVVNGVAVNATNPDQTAAHLLSSAGIDRAKAVKPEGQA